MKSNIFRALTVLAASMLLSLVVAGCSTVNAALMRGDSIADLQLRRQVYDAIKADEKDCYGKSIGRGLGWYNNPTFCDIRFADTRVIEPRKTPKAPWKESWVVQRDGVYAYYTVLFYQDDKGATAFNINFPPELRDVKVGGAQQ